MSTGGVAAAGRRRAGVSPMQAPGPSLHGGVQDKLPSAIKDGEGSC